MGNDAQTTFSPTLPESNFNIYCENHGSAMGSKYTISIDKIVETYWVKVEDQAGANKFVFYTDSNYQYQVSSGTTITLKKLKYQFDQSDSSNDGHKLEIRIPKIIDNVLQPVGNDRNLDEVLNIVILVVSMEWLFLIPSMNLEFPEEVLQMMVQFKFSQDTLYVNLMDKR